MCGLAGIFNLDGRPEVDRALLVRMTTALAHRGPDGDGFHVEPGMGLGHRRLAVIDPRGGAQPMRSAGGSAVLAFNGEIYNFRALRQTLQQAGHHFLTSSDTEVILHAWEEYGVDCLAHLSGMFAFALWDADQRTLFLARDRMGEKPLYYTCTGGMLMFASEIGALRAHPGLQPRIDPRAVDDYFALGYVPDPSTIFTGIHRLPAAHFALVRRGDPGLAPQRYWRATGTSHGGADAAAELTTRLRESVRAQMVADVPLGAFLSGGIDSGAVVTLASGLRDGPLDTFTIGFAGGEDERPAAALVAARTGSTHRANAGAFDMIDAARWQASLFGEPFGDMSAVPTAMVSALARRHVTVALSGDGGDEVFGGYRRYRWHRLTDAVRRYIPAGQRRRVFGALARAYPKLDRAPRWLRAKHTLNELSLDSALGYYNTVCKTHDARRRALFSPELEAQLDGHDPARRFRTLMDGFDDRDALQQAQLVDLETYLPGDILTKVDRASMAVSLEVRAPFLDHGLVAWGVGLPARDKLRGAQGKHVLRTAMRAHLPPEILDRRKQGFASSPASQFRAAAPRLRGRLLGDMMLGSGMFQPDTLGQLVDEHAAGTFDHSQVLWQLLVFEGFLWRQAQRQDAPAQPFVLQD